MTVEALFELLIPRLAAARPNVAFIDAVQGAVDVVTDHLWRGNSDLLLTEYDEAIGQGFQAVTFDDTFLGMSPEPPSLLDTDGNFVRHLFPLPQGQKHKYSSPATPEYYQLRGNTLMIYPEPDASYTVVGEVYSRPVAITSMAATLPFGGIFDRRVIADAVLHLSHQGMIAVTDQAFRKMVERQVDSVIPNRSAKRLRWNFPGIL